jgi:putative addiction module component (TIGR02574 family)
MNERSIDIDRLDVEQRLRLIERIWESLSKDPGAIPMTPAQRAELDRRLDEVEQGDTGGIPWEEVLESIRKRMG